MLSGRLRIGFPSPARPRAPRPPPSRACRRASSQSWAAWWRRAPSRACCSRAAGTAARPALTLVKAAEIDKAAETLPFDEKDKIVAEAKACRAPLGQMRLSKMAADAGGVVRIRAGNYLSPAFNIADGPINIAVPFPAPYETGKGEITVEGAAKDVFVELTPGLKVDTTGGVQRIPVIWNTSKPCGG